MKATTSLIALSVLTALSFSAPVFGQVKGGEKLAGLRAPVTTTAAATSMNCPTETRTAVDHAGGRGAFKKVSVYTAHLCPSCKNAEVTRGAGKLATRTVKHTCETATVCCNVKN
jgi:hypothetical protein